ncbi:hypothetical protein ACS0TY_029863 [Phlomoides rotata]
MDSSATPWLSETFIPLQWVEDTNFTDEFDILDYLDEDLVPVLGDEMQMCLLPQNNSSLSSSMIDIESSNSISLISSICPTSKPVVLNFGNPHSPVHEEPAKDAEVPPKRAKRATRFKQAEHAYDHTIAERKRREQLSRHFIALSAILPGLKKMDKLSILGDAIKHMKDLQVRVERLEEEATKKSAESVVSLKKSQIQVENNGNRNGSLEEKKVPEIEARVCNTQLLIRIQCEYRKGLLANLIVQLEKLNLTILSNFATQFGMLALEITFIIQMEKEFNLNVNEVVKSLQVVIMHDL